MQPEPNFLQGAVPVDEAALRNLNKWLTLEGLTPLMIGAAFWIPFSLIATILILAALVFMPYMLWQLAIAKRFVAIKWFCVIVGVPAVTALLLGHGHFPTMWIVFPLLMFYLYTWGLRHYVGLWLSDLEIEQTFDQR